ncbi:hypothetical protein GCM10009677_39210 [Sphaerisporangium rubeum]|uniref:AMIN-like domain-containing protein n=1 Tax=Sphaerisporangium rubeum TaxID=321317 RepID=A0A7X0IB40_9ACTN|nr:hypothetical protein [Sphaerisporangium rubeum]MBB6471945.1 hypothetical protein [Sphaerisporangium rubeum]
MRRLAVAAALVPLAFAAACGGTPGSPPAATATVAPTPQTPNPSAEPTTGPTAEPTAAPTVSASTIPAPASPTTTVPAPSSTGPGAPTSTEQVKVTRTPERPPLVTGIRTAAHADKGFDRVVVDLRGARTGYTVGYVRQVVQDGSGDVVPMKGDAFLQITLTPAQAHSESGKPTLGRTPVLNAELVNVRGVLPVGDFEGVVTVAIGLRHRAGFRVFEQRDPARLVVDIAHRRA